MIPYIRILLAITCAYLLSQTLCAWFNESTVLCHVSGACLPSWLCTPCVSLTLGSISSLYSGYAKALWITTQTLPALTCVHNRLALAPPSTVGDALATASVLQSKGLTIGHDTKTLMKGLETNVVYPTRDMTIEVELAAAKFKHDIKNNTHINATALSTMIKHRCTSLSGVVSASAVEAMNMGTRMDDFANDVREFGILLRHKWVPKFTNHKDSKVATSVKVFGMSVAVGAALTLSATTFPLVSLLGLCTAITGGAYVVGQLEQTWEEDGILIRQLGTDINPYADLMDHAVAAINAAATELETIESGLIRIHTHLTTIMAIPSPTESQYTIWTDIIITSMRTLRDHTAEVSAAINAERRHLLAQHATAVSATTVC